MQQGFDGMKQAATNLQLKLW